MSNERIEIDELSKPFYDIGASNDNVNQDELGNWDVIDLNCHVVCTADSKQMAEVLCDTLNRYLDYRELSREIISRNESIIGSPLGLPQITPEQLLKLSKLTAILIAPKT